MGIDDESSHPEVCSEVAGGVTRNIVCLFREPDAGNLPVRLDEREQETGSSQTGLRRVRESAPTATGRLQPLRLFSTLLAISLIDPATGVLSVMAVINSYGSGAQWARATPDVARTGKALRLRKRVKFEGAIA
jgi:hypothetical protein